MCRMSRFLVLGSWVVVGGVLACGTAQAQIVGDRTLPNNSNINTSNNIAVISGGTQAGGNLFHSFKEFSVPTGTTAYFNNAGDIQNIISRVTGKSISNIDGLIRANGSANLFLINPNGIVFGRGAKLDIGGSFVATTANAIQFGQNGFFSASNPEASSPLLSVNPSALLFNQITAASIQNNSVAPTGLDPSGTFTANGLRVKDGQNLFLVGGNVSMDGGGLFAFGGRVELGGLAGAGTVGLNGDGKNLSLSFSDGVARSDVSLTNGAQVNVRAQDGGSITINARNVELAGGSRLEAGIADGIGSTYSKAGNIEVNAQALVNLNDGGVFYNYVQPGATGQGGDISITTGSLIVQNGFQVNTSTLGKGDAGNIIITARDTVSLNGVNNNINNNNPTNANSDVKDGGVGKGGSISITTGSLSVTNGAVLITSGEGNSGSITINARDRVSFEGVGNKGMINIASGAYTSIFLPQVVGNGGDISISAGSLTVGKGAKLSARTFGNGNAGNIIITARDSVSFDGVSNSRGPSGAFTSVEAGGVGKGGDISITTDSLSVRNGAQINASSNARGTAGEIKVTSRSIGLDNQALMLATTASGNGGNITLRNQDLLLLRRGSQISTTAGTASAGGDGGNITINAPNGFIVANKRENSDITANAFTGAGGRVQINSSGVFGIEFREKENPQTSDITASSQFGVNGIVQINTPDIDPYRGLIDLPVEPSEPKLATGCQADVAQQSQFIITGRGGLPPNPREVLKSNSVQVDWVSLERAGGAGEAEEVGGVGGSGEVGEVGGVGGVGRQRSRSSDNTHNANYVNNPKNEIVEAQGWVVDANGNVTLVATAPTSTPHSPWFTPTSCPQSKI